MWLWPLKMPIQNLLRLLLLLMIVLATVCCRFVSWGLVIKLNFCSDFEHKVWSRLWSWSSGNICMVKKIFYVGKKADKAVDIGYPCHSLSHSLRHLFPYNLFVTRCCCLVEILKLVHGRDYEKEIWSRFVFEPVMWPIRLLCKDELNHRVRCAFGNVSSIKLNYPLI